MTEGHMLPGPGIREIDWTVLWAPAAALLVAFLAKHFFLTEILLEGPRIWVHEFGHALNAWLASRAATPLGIGWTNVNPERSLWVYLCFSFLLGVGVYRSVLAKLWFSAAALGLLMIFQNWFTWTFSSVRFEEAMVYGGVGGELYLGAFLMIAFFARFPERVRWDWLKFPVLLVGAYALLHTWILWWKISNHRADMPLGSLWGGQSDAGGDMNRLLDEFGWTRKEIIVSYLKTARLSGFAVAVAYAIAAVRSLTRRSTVEDQETA
jgi:hypothetical protein